MTGPVGPADAKSSNASFAVVGSVCNGSTQMLTMGFAACDFTENGVGLVGTLAPKGLLGFSIDEV